MRKFYILKNTNEWSISLPKNWNNLINIIYGISNINIRFFGNYNLYSFNSICSIGTHIIWLIELKGCPYINKGSRYTIFTFCYNIYFKKNFKILLLLLSRTTTDAVTQLFLLLIVCYLNNQKRKKLIL